ncbi:MULTISPECIES: PAS domain-containing sensor histidine kinase [Bacillus]|uniref:PAS domain-containing sensor histidine kinase n=1 Tax=Bacillus TaxID=1386 RepID=UPI000BB80D5C|nr:MULTISPECIES: PAS domain-containing sensor histidine kinase [Bacillus]
MVQQLFKEDMIQLQNRLEVLEKELEKSKQENIMLKNVIDHAKSKHMYQDVFYRAVDSIAVFDRDGKFIDMNPAFCSSFSLNKQDFQKYELEQFVEEQYLYKIEKMWKLLDSNGKVRGELPVLLQNGNRKRFEFTITANVYDDYYLAILRDVTEKRSMENQLQKSEERFRAMFEHALDAIVLIDNKCNIVRANPAASRTFELPLNYLIEGNLKGFVQQTYEQKVNNIIAEFKNRGEIRDELEFLMPNGQKKLLEFTANKGIIDGYNMVIFRNVSERRKMEKDLREKEQKFRRIFDNALDGIVLWDKNANIIDANPNASKIIGLTKKEITELKLTDYIPIEQQQEMKEQWVQSGKYGALSGEFICENAHGTRLLEFSAKKNVIDGLNMTFFRDITDKKEMEEQLKKSDTLTVVGELAAGIAHEIRNPMTALKGFIQLLQSSTKDETNAMYFDVITSELKRIESIITEFLVLAKPQATSYQRKNVAVIMKETLDLMSAQATLEDVQFATYYEENLQELYCEPKQLKQVFINILKNAFEVMPKGGTITVNVESKDNEHVVVSIEDQGIGIPEDKIKKLGEPFYTTKDRGTGLGLMVSYKIVEEHEGAIEVTSEVGKGTIFYITLPINQKLMKNKQLEG